MGETALEKIGNTPLLRLENVSAKFSGIEVLAKAEWHNPGGSVKDRAASRIVSEAQRSGQLRGGVALLDATSGNTGIAMALMARLFGLEIELVLPQNSTRERVLTMEAFGAKVTLLESIEACRDYADAQ